MCKIYICIYSINYSSLRIFPILSDFLLNPSSQLQFKLKETSQSSIIEQ